MQKMSENTKATLEDAIYCVKSQLGMGVCEECRLYKSCDVFCDNVNGIILAALEEIQQYRAIGTLDECREAVERMKPKTPTYDGDGYAPDGTFVWDEWLCPNCNSRHEVDSDEYDYCPNCGQKILWEKSNE